MLPPSSYVSGSFWRGSNVFDHLRSLQETIALLKAMQKELDMLLLIKGPNGSLVDENKLSSSCLTKNISPQPLDASILGDVFQTKRNDLALMHSFSEVIKLKRISSNVQEFLSLETMKSLYLTLKSKLIPLDAITNQTSSWEEKSASVKLASKLIKFKRNKRWKKKKRKHIAEMLSKERERYDQADQDADEWRAREIAKDIAKRKVEKMKGIAKLKAREERQWLESELELVLIVEKLQELRSIKIQKMKKQGHFLPEEDDKFLEQVQAAVEEEERQVAAAADKDAAKDAIATAESKKAIKSRCGDLWDGNSNKDGGRMCLSDPAETNNGSGFCSSGHAISEWRALDGQACGGGYNSIANLPVEFYHYYHGSNTDMGTLIEVRRSWDAYIRLGGSRIPGHWIQPPPPADEIWASYLVS